MLGDALLEGQRHRFEAGLPVEERLAEHGLAVLDADLRAFAGRDVGVDGQPPTEAASAHAAQGRAAVLAARAKVQLAKEVSGDAWAASCMALATLGEEDDGAL